MGVRFILTRLAQSVLTIFGAVTVVFLILRLTPGNPAEIMLGDYSTPQLVAQLNQQWGLDKPLWVQYAAYLKNVLTGNFGHSFALQGSVLFIVTSNIKYTVVLAVAAMIVMSIVGIPLGIIGALKRNTMADYASMFIALLGIATPNFWLALIMIYVLSFKLGWFPVQGSGQAGNVMDELKHLILPAVALGIREAALVARTTRSAILDVMSDDHIRTARSKGLSERRVFRLHVFRNALLPVVTIIGIYFGSLLGGATIIEIVFGRPGLGKLLVNAILQRDYPLSQALIIFFLVGVVLVNLVVDLMYGLLDPRLRAE